MLMMETLIQCRIRIYKHTHTCIHIYIYILIAIRIGSGQVEIGRTRIHRMLYLVYAVLVEIRVPRCSDQRSCVTCAILPVEGSKLTKSPTTTP